MGNYPPNNYPPVNGLESRYTFGYVDKLVPGVQRREILGSADAFRQISLGNGS